MKTFFSETVFTPYSPVVLILSSPDAGPDGMTRYAEAQRSNTNSFGNNRRAGKPLLHLVRKTISTLYPKRDIPLHRKGILYKRKHSCLHDNYDPLPRTIFPHRGIVCKYGHLFQRDEQTWKTCCTRPRHEHGRFHQQ
jgi:hypothetical protein